MHAVQLSSTYIARAVRCLDGTLTCVGVIYLTRVHRPPCSDQVRHLLASERYFMFVSDDTTVRVMCGHTQQIQFI